MMPKVFIIDTNVLIAGIITKNNQSPTVQIVDAILTGNIIFLLSPELLKEYIEVLSRPKLKKLHGLSDSEIEHLLSEITANAVWQEPVERYQAPDSGDNHLWDLLMMHDNCVLITGDQVLIEKPPSVRSVITPASYIKLFFNDFH